MTQHTKITPENVTDYPVDSELEFRFGAYYPSAYGRVTGHRIYSPTKWNPSPSAELLAEYINPEDDEVVETTVSMFSTVGIGVYLISAAEKPETKSKSPWAT